MSRWTYWEWIAYSVLFVAAILIALDQGVKLAPELMQQFHVFIANPYWAFAPLAFVILATLILSGHEFGVLGKKPINPGDDAWDEGVKLERLYNRKFVNESVSLDGRHFVNPIFDNVTFFFQGTAPVFVENPTYIIHNGKMGSRLASRNKVITMALKIHDNLLKAAGLPVQTLNLGPEATFDAPKMNYDGAAIENNFIPSTTPILNRMFKNEDVQLDGYEYINCSFENVTFYYNGTAASRMTNITFSPDSTIRLMTKNPIIQQAMIIMDTLQKATRTDGPRMELRHQS